MKKENYNMKTKPVKRCREDVIFDLIDVMKYSLIIISSVPVLIMYPLVQKHFVKGVMIGSVKG